MQLNSALGRSSQVCPQAPIQRVKRALFQHPRRLGGYICAQNEFHESDSYAASMEGLTNKPRSKVKDPSRFVADTSDEEANLPDNPIDLDEEMMIPQRPTISDYYKDVRHEWKEPDLTKSGKIVADTSDEESNLPGDPIDLDEEMMLPQKHMVKEIYKNLPGHQQQHQQKKEGCTCNETKKNKNTAGTSTDCGAAVPGSKEMPEVAEPKHGAREEKMVEAEEDVTKMESQGHGDPHPRSPSNLPGLVTQDTTLINHDSPVEFQQSGVAENEERIHAIDKIAEDENRRYLKNDEKNEEQQEPPSTADALSAPPSSSSPPPSPHQEDLRSAFEENPSTEASYTGLEGGIEDQIEDHSQATPVEEEESYEINFSGDDDEIILDSNGGAGGGGGDGGSDTLLGRVEFSFKAEDKEENKKNPSPPTSERLRDVAAKAAASGRELDPLTKLAAVRQAYREHRILTEESLRQTKPTVTMARILEITAGRAAAIGVFAAVGSEILLGQSVLSQLLGRWEGFRQVEPVISQSRTLALACFALCLGITATETLFSGAAPPAGKYFGFGPKQQIWAGRMAMFAFLGLVVYEIMHSNRPMF